MSRSLEQRLDDIEDAISRIGAAEALLDSAPSGAERDALFDAILYRLLVVGEAVKAIPPDISADCPEVPWMDVARLRDPSCTTITEWTW